MVFSTALQIFVKMVLEVVVHIIAPDSQQHAQASDSVTSRNCREAQILDD